VHGWQSAMDMINIQRIFDSAANFYHFYVNEFLLSLYPLVAWFFSLTPDILYNTSPIHFVRLHFLFEFEARFVFGFHPFVYWMLQDICMC